MFRHPAWELLELSQQEVFTILLCHPVESFPHLLCKNLGCQQAPVVLAALPVGKGDGDHDDQEDVAGVRGERGPREGLRLDRARQGNGLGLWLAPHGGCVLVTVCGG